jgi:aldose sugar dehydrogenase
MLLSILRRRAVVASAALALGAMVVVTGGPLRAASIAARPVVSGLRSVAAFTVAPDGRIFYGERFTGRIRVFNPSTSASSTFFTIPNLAKDGEQGLLGLALHPNYPSAPYVYAFASRTTTSGVRNQIVRITDTGAGGSAMKVIFRATASSIHNGGRILFGPDGKLYAVIGDNSFPERAQSSTSRAGKVLRMSPAGAIPADNPKPNSYVFASGVRNSFGFDFDPVSGRLWKTDNGPECNDELNRVPAGANLGWGPSHTCSTPPQPPVNTNQDGSNPFLPQRFYTPPIAPTGAAFCSGCALGAGGEGALFFGAFNTGEIRRVTLTTDRLGVASQGVAYTHTDGIVSIEAAPGGRLLFGDGAAIYRLVSV